MSETTDEESGLVVELSRAAQRLQRSSSETEALRLIVSGAVDTVPGAEQAGVSLLHRDGGVTSAATSDPTVDEVDQLQADYQEGPCVTALREQHTVIVDDLTVETDRWPRFAPDATALRVASMLSFHLFTRDDTVGALNLYSGSPRSFGTESQLLGGLFAAHAATALGGARHVAQLHRALATRDLIGQAKGILMERFDLDADAAFQLLVRSSQDANMKLVAVARWLTRAEASDEQDA
ncbi:GAF domain-containing protein [Actinopolyspora xinjiangensis]|nr:MULTISPECIES: GAF and ANTAR domain-containing protein [Actinopolyspora]SDP87028.1 GAF domain-containing protein [Actinopolyspora xinjiangensis]